MDKLREICQKKSELVRQRKSYISEDTLRMEALRPGKTRGFIDALKKAKAEKRIGLIAEIKKASPSHGEIREDFDPVTLAQAYERGGATCLSVLTDEPYFHGHDAYLGQARNACNLPVLRKDFIIDPYQVIESRAIGADAILLIMAVLSDKLAHTIYRAAFEWGLDVLVEVHTLQELQRARQILNPILIGVNNRDLHTLNVNLHVSEHLSGMIPANVIGISESGIQTHEHIVHLQEYGYNTFLVGEALMRQADVEQATRTLLGNV